MNMLGLGVSQRVCCLLPDTEFGAVLLFSLVAG